MSDVVIIAEDDNDGSILVPESEVINSCGSTGKTVTVKEAEFHAEVEKWLNDFITVTDRQWSTHELTAALNALKSKIDAVINDNTIQSTTAWSSLKTYQQVINAVTAVKNENEKYTDEQINDRISALLNEVDLWIVNSEAFQNLQLSIDLVNGPIELENSLAWRLEQTKTAILEIEAQARADAIQALADTTILEFEVMNERLQNQIQDEATERFNRVSELLSEIEVNRNLIQTETTTRATEVASLSAVQSVVAATFDVNAASFLTMTETFSNEHTSFVNQLTALNTNLKGKAESNVVVDLTSRVSTVENTTTAQGQAITALQNVIFEDETGNITIDGLAVFDLEQRVTVNEQEISGISSALTLVENTIPNLATSSALEGLESRVTSTEEGITSSGQRITTIENQITNDEIVANSASYDLLNNAVSTVNDLVVAEANKVTGLTTRIDDAEGSIVEEARIRQNEDSFLSFINNVQQASMAVTAAAISTTDEIFITENEARITDLTVLQASVNDVSGSVTDLNQIVIENEEATISRFEQIEANVGDTSAEITSLAQTVVSNESAQSLRSEAIENRVDDVEGTFNDIVLIDVNGSGTLAERLQDIRGKTDTATANITTLENLVIGNETSEGLVDKTEQLTLTVFDENTGISSIAQKVTGIESNLDPLNPSSLAYDLSQIQMQITNGDLGVTIEAAIQESNTIETINNGLDTLLAQRTVKIENDGLITGYTIVNDGTEGTIAFRADNFFITPSNLNNASTRLTPFFVDATENKVYMDNAFIRNLNAEVITAGKFTAERIDTRGLDIKDNAGNVLFSANQNLDWDLISGTNKPANNATRNTGIFANLNGKITSGNVSTYIDNVAIQNAQIANLAVTEGKISNLSVSTLKIQNQAVTFPNYVVRSNTWRSNFSSETTIASLRISTTGAPLIIQAFLNAEVTRGDFTSHRNGQRTYRFRLYRGNSNLISTRFLGFSKEPNASWGNWFTGGGLASISIRDQPPAGTYTYSIRVIQSWASNSSACPLSVYTRSIFTTELKK